MSESKHIVLGVTGSIAAYKSADLVRMMVKRGWDVSVVMTEGATHFITELTLRTLSRNKVYVDMFEETDEWCPEHISLSDRGDLFLLAPCTANVIGKIAHGISDDVLTASVMATDCPVLIAPAMNSKMWNNPAVQDNVKLLRNRGIEVLDTESGDLACGYEGDGRLVSLDTIVSRVDELIG